MISLKLFSNISLEIKGTRVFRGLGAIIGKEWDQNTIRQHFPLSNRNSWKLDQSKVKELDQQSYDQISHYIVPFVQKRRDHRHATG